MYHQLALKYQHRLTKQKFKENEQRWGKSQTIVLANLWKENFKLSENSQGACCSTRVNLFDSAKIKSEI